MQSQMWPLSTPGCGPQTLYGDPNDQACHGASWACCPQPSILPMGTCRGLCPFPRLGLAAEGGHCGQGGLCSQAAWSFSLTKGRLCRVSGDVPSPLDQAPLVAGCSASKHPESYSLLPLPCCPSSWAADLHPLLYTSLPALVERELPCRPF